MQKYKNKFNIEIEPLWDSYRKNNRNMSVIRVSNFILCFPLFLSEIIAIASSSKETFLLVSSLFLFMSLAFMTKLISSLSSAFKTSSTNSSLRLLQTFNNRSFFDIASFSFAFRISIWSFFLLFHLTFFCSSRYALYLCLDAFTDLISWDESSIFEGFVHVVDDKFSGNYWILTDVNFINWFFDIKSTFNSCLPLT